MSTLASAVFDHDSDENDSDFVPDAKADSEDEGKGTTEPPATVKSEIDTIKQKQDRASLWDNFQASTTSVASDEAAKASQPKLVKIEKRYRFAGETVSEVVEVPEDSDDAKKWPLADQTPTGSIPQDTPGSGSEPATSVSQPDTRETSSGTPSYPPNAPSNEPSPSSFSTPDATTQKPPAKRPAPRKPKTVLTPLPSQTKPKRLTTLEKSAMDWQTHIQSTSSPSASVVSEGAGESMADELERNRRGGGYLERIGFLERVGERRDELFEDSRSKRRRT